MKREKDTVYISAISGGKDSVTMADLLCKHNYPIDEIIFTDTLEEFEDMYKYIEKLKVYFETRYGQKITVLTPNSTFDDWAFGKIEKESAKRTGQIRGIPTKDGMCYWRRESKIYPMERYLRKKYGSKTKIVQYIGYTKGENRSIQNTATTSFFYPLKDVFKMTEEDCKAYLINQEMENPLYQHFSRTGCAMCPFQSDQSYYQVYMNYPNVWGKMKDREKRLQQCEDEGDKVINKHWFIGRKTCEEMEQEFNMKSKSLFDFSDEPLKDCFCKI